MLKLTPVSWPGAMLHIDRIAVRTIYKTLLCGAEFNRIRNQSTNKKFCHFPNCHICNWLRQKLHFPPFWLQHGVKHSMSTSCSQTDKFPLYLWVFFLRLCKLQNSSFKLSKSFYNLIPKTLVNIRLQKIEWLAKAPSTYKHKHDIQTRTCKSRWVRIKLDFKFKFVRNCHLLLFSWENTCIWGQWVCKTWGCSANSFYWLPPFRKKLSQCAEHNKWCIWTSCRMYFCARITARSQQQVMWHTSDCSQVLMWSHVYIQFLWCLLFFFNY